MPRKRQESASSTPMFYSHRVRRWWAALVSFGGVRVCWFYTPLILYDLQGANEPAATSQMPRKRQESASSTPMFYSHGVRRWWAALVSFGGVRVCWFYTPLVWMKQSTKKNLDTANNERRGGQPTYWTLWNDWSQQRPQDTETV
uniref:Transmembrane protein n=1 Tax=Ascaris lumbricoides TaxID=6252 RepID=A0A0M3I8J6_ASCLU